MRGKPRLTKRYAPKRDGPVFWAYLDRPGQTFPGESGDVYDLVGRTSTLVRSGGCTWTSGNNGQCLSFDGSSGYASVATSKAPVGSSARTFIATLTPSNLSGAANRFAVSSSAVAGGSSFLLGIGYLSGVNYPFATFAAAGFDLHGTTACVVNQTYRIAGTFDGVGTEAVYCNGTREGTKSVPAVNTTSSILYLGKHSGGERFPGLIDNVQIYDYALTDQQIAYDAADPFWRLRRKRRSPSKKTTILFRRTLSLRSGSRGVQ